MVGPVQPVAVTASDLSALLVQAVTQILEQSTELALLNLKVAAGANPDGIGELLDVLA